MEKAEEEPTFTQFRGTNIEVMETPTVYAIVETGYEQPLGLMNTARLRVNVAPTPFALFGVMVYVVAGDSNRGVPEITPVPPFILNPIGRNGLMT